MFLLALLKRQGVNVKGLLKADPIKEEPQPYIDCTGNLQVWLLKLLQLFYENESVNYIDWKLLVYPRLVNYILGFLELLF